MSRTSKTIQDLFDIQVEDLKQTLDTLSIFDAADEYSSVIVELDNKLTSLHHLLEIRESLQIDDSSYESKDSFAATTTDQSPVTFDVNKGTTANLSRRYVFERKLRGGVVHLDNDEEYYVPEQMVRDMDILHGAKVSIIDEYEHNKTTRYIFHVEENGTNDRPGRVEVKGCRVHVKEFNKLYAVNESTRETYPINMADISTYGINYMDTVDIAYYENNPTNISVIHKHKTPPYATSTKKSFLIDTALVATKEFIFPPEDYKKILADSGYSINRLKLCYGTEMMFTLNNYAGTMECFIVDPALKDEMSATIQLFQNANKKVYYARYLDELKKGK